MKQRSSGMGGRDIDSNDVAHDGECRRIVAFKCNHTDYLMGSHQMGWWRIKQWRLTMIFPTTVVSTIDTTTEDVPIYADVEDLCRRINRRTANRLR